MAEQLPQKFGNYTLHKLIARGGMAEIYRATMPGIGGFEKTVAIKKILPHLAEDTEFVTMLKDEANILVSISDSNIAQVYDLGRIGDSYYIAMEYVHGLDLSHVIKGMAKQNALVPVDHATYIASCICAGLHAAHTNTDKQGRPLNIVHRDVSPHNVIISFAGDVKLIDFGVAKAAVKENHTQVGVIKGKLLYMAPEQAMAKTLDGRADLFAAGLCLYKMLTNELPFRGENEFQIYNNILSKEIVPPRELNPKVPQELNQIVMTLLQRDPDKRYQDGYSAKQDLRRALQNIAPGYTVNRLGRWTEDNFSKAAIQRRNAQRDTSGPNPMAPKTPSATSVGTGQLLADSDLQEVSMDSLDAVMVESGPHQGFVSASPPPSPGHASLASDGALRTQKNDDEETGKFGQQQLAAPAQAPDAADTPQKVPAALYIVGALLVAVGVLFGLTLLDDDPVEPQAQPTQPAQPTPTPKAAAAVPPSLTVTVYLDSTPSGADILRGSDLLGTTPQELTLRRSEEALDISIKKEGYTPLELEIIPSDDLDKIVELTPSDALDPLADDASETYEGPGAKASAKPPAEPKKPSKTTKSSGQSTTKPPPKPAPKPPPKSEEPDFDLWGDEPAEKVEKKAPAPVKKPAKQPTPKPEKKKEKKQDKKSDTKKDEKPTDILNPFG